MNSSRPYLLRGLYEWIVENNCTPYIAVNAMRDDVSVPLQYVQDGQIVLNISPGAVRDLALGNEELNCSCRFDGKPFSIIVPIDAVMAIYARENGRGMVFEEEDETPNGDPDITPPIAPRPKPKAVSKKPSLKVVK